ncbi:hypothetical protein ACROYT_G043986 [Oculina patagonica]
MKIQEKSFATEVVMVFLAVLLAFVTILGNGFYLAIFARFKVFRRNFTNILIASLAVVDCLNVLFNVPLFTLFFVVEPSWLKGKAWAILSYSLRLEFGFLNLVSMTALIADRFFAVRLPLKYFTWKTTKKAKIAVFLMWLVCTKVVVLLAVPLFNMDLDGVPVGISRKVIFEKEKLIVGLIVVLFTIASTVLGILTSYSIYQTKKERMLLNLPPLRAEARLKMDIEATKTVAMTTGLYYICYIPTIVFSIWRRNNETKIINAWFVFMVSFLGFLSSALNPIIYVLRYQRTRSAFRQFLKDPCGTSAYREDPVRNKKEARQREKKPQIEGEELKDGRDSAASERPGPNPGTDTRPPTSAKHQIYQSRGVVKVAWEENEKDSGRLDEQVAVAGQPRRDGEKVQDQDVRSSGSMKERSKTVNAAGGKEIGTSSGVKARPRRTSVL